MKNGKAKTAKTAKAKDCKSVILFTGAEDRQALAAKAARYTGGNLSAWLRHAGRNYRPEPGEKIELLPSYMKARRGA